MVMATYKNTSVLVAKIDFYYALAAVNPSYIDTSDIDTSDLIEIKDSLKEKLYLTYIGASHEDFFELYRQIERIDHLFSKELTVKSSRFLGVTLLLPAIVEEMKGLSRGEGKKTLINYLNVTNDKRLYWVWASATVPLLLSCVGQPEASGSIGVEFGLGQVGLVTGSMSWMLYFLRGALEWHSLLSHTFECLMSDEEREYYRAHPEITWTDRFKTQWAKKKYALMNDTFWGLCNFACFWLLVGSHSLVCANYALTLLLLFMDLSLMLYRWREVALEHQEEIASFEQDIEALTQKVNAEFNPQAKEIAEQQLQWMRHRKEIVQNQHAYELEKAGLDAIYAILLFAAFAMVMIAAFPPVVMAPAAVACLGVVGTLFCFALNILNNGLGIYCEIEKHEKNIKVHEQYNILGTDISHEQQHIAYQRARLLSSTIEALVIPPLVMVSFALLPWGVGIPLLVTAFLLIGLMHYQVSQLKPKVELKEPPELENDQPLSSCSILPSE